MLDISKIGITSFLNVNPPSTTLILLTFSPSNFLIFSVSILRPPSLVICQSNVPFHALLYALCYSSPPFFFPLCPIPNTQYPIPIPLHSHFVICDSSILVVRLYPPTSIREASNFILLSLSHSKLLIFPASLHALPYAIPLPLLSSHYAQYPIPSTQSPFRYIPISSFVTRQSLLFASILQPQSGKRPTLSFSASHLLNFLSSQLLFTLCPMLFLSPFFLPTMPNTQYPVPNTQSPIPSHSHCVQRIHNTLEFSEELF